MYDTCFWRFTLKYGEKKDNELQFVAHYLFICVPGMARIQLEINQPQVVTAKCSEPQVVNSDDEDGGSGVAILSSVRTEI